MQILSGSRGQTIGVKTTGAFCQSLQRKTGFISERMLRINTNVPLSDLLMGYLGIERGLFRRPAKKGGPNRK